MDAIQNWEHFMTKELLSVLGIYNATNRISVKQLITNHFVERNENGRLRNYFIVINKF